MPVSNKTDESRQSIGNTGFAPVFAVASSTAMPVPYHQAISEVPEGIKTTPLDPSVKMTNKSTNRLIIRTATIVTYWCNTPLVDGLRSVSSIYKMVAAAAFNYQRQHQDAFFEAYPELVIKKDGEELTTAALRRNYKLYAKRIAHYWYEFGEAKKMQLAALLNLMNLTRLNSNETMKNIASDVKWARINTACPLAERFPSPTGLEAFMLDHTRYALGDTTYGSNICAVGLWIADPFGNRSMRAIPLDASYVSKGTDTAVLVSDNATTPYSDNEDLSALIANISEVIHDCGPFSRTKWGDAYQQFVPENSATRVIQRGEASTIVASMNDTNNRETDEPKPGKFGVTSQLTKALWSQFDYWTGHLTFGFSAMMDPNNDRYTFAVEQLHLFQPSSTNEDIIKVVRNNQPYDIVDLANHMVYKQTNHANTATVVKFAPALWTDDATSFESSDALITKNFERYAVDATNTIDIIRSGKRWPHINPTMFTITGRDSTEEPVVANATMTFGSTKQHSISGKAATLLDYTVSCSVSPDISRVEGYGVSSDVLEKYVEDGNSIVYEELPDTPWVMVQPLFDTSDIMQCGFNILIADDEKNPSEWTRFLTDPKTYNAVSEETFARTGSALVGTERVPLLKAFGTLDADTNSYKRAHIVNPEYRRYVKHAIVFVGGAVFSQPWFAAASKSTGYYPLKIEENAETAAAIVTAQKIHTDSVYANNVIRAFATISGMAASWQSQSGGAQNNPMLGLLSSYTDPQTVFDTYFSVEYPPVEPITMLTPSNNKSNVLPKLFLSNESYENVDKIAAFTPSAALASPENPGDVMKAFSGRVVAFDPFITHTKELVFFLNRFVFPKVTVDQFGGYTATLIGESPIIDVSDISSWVYTLTSRLITQFVGIHDTKPFWSDIEMSKADPVIGTSVKFPENNILALPRAVQAKGRAPDQRPSRQTSSLSDEINSVTASNGGRKDESRDDSRASKTHRGNKRGFQKSGRARFKDQDRKGFQSVVVNDDATEGKVSRGKDQIADLGSEGGKLDLSSIAEDKKFNKVSKRPMSASTAVQMQ